MEKELVIATYNLHKLEEIRGILPRLRLKLRPLSEFPGASPAEEDGLTLEENASKKALAAARHTGLWSLADDTGLEVDALGGAPGVRSARFAGENAGAAANNALLLEKLAGVPAERRTARFACVVALASPSGALKLARGTLEGRIALSPSGGNGFGYDPLFEIGSGPGTLAGLSAAAKNALSHRARALAAILPELEKI
jgi:XTP/dITP diphosphohydrolase